MNTFILIVGVILLALAVTLLIQAVAGPKGGSQQVFEQIGAYGFRGFVSRDDTAESGPRESLSELPTRIGAWLSRHVGNSKEAEVRRRLVAAGWYSVTPAAFAGYRLLGGIGVTFAFLLFG